ncbi:hypothetical protein A8990_10111 [Paenibacillus taihuensis]|uniref:Uncharacterized protein n=1 Tax=Paenibacillus taihuensis TaxID=1156355 RepID=A0A3D9SR76_9BACL|nr:hypothetical protein A8990_10111 [Paenibacillus taihuensis]
MHSKAATEWKKSKFTTRNCHSPQQVFRDRLRVLIYR